MVRLQRWLVEEQTGGVVDAVGLEDELAVVLCLVKMVKQRWWWHHAA